MTAIIVFAPVNLLNLNLDDFGPAMLAAFPVGEERVCLDDPWDLALCGEPAPFTQYSTRQVRCLRERFKMLAKGLVKRKKPPQEIIILQHNSGINCHKAQKVFVSDNLAGLVEDRIAIASYSRINACQTFTQLQRLLSGRACRTKWNRYAKEALPQFRMRTMTDLQVKILTSAQMDSWQSFSTIHKWGKSLGIKIPASINAIGDETNLQIKKPALQRAIIALVTSIQKHPGCWA